MPYFSSLFQYTLVVLGCILGLVVLASAVVWFYSRPYIVANTEELSPTQVAIILGAGVYSDGSLTSILQERVDMAVTIYETGLVDKILMSGDNGTRDYNEVSPVHQYLLESGVPAEDIFLDYAGFDTYDTMYRARAVFGVESAVIVTQPFHLPRAVFIADALGIDAEGVNLSIERSSWRNYLRESLARVKAVYDVKLKSTPTYLGEQIPITGDGRESVGE